MATKRRNMNGGDDDSCVICFGEEGECDVYFSPCLHKACKSCVQKLRIANVYKADKGVKCPICRQTIEGYLDTPIKVETGTGSSPEKNYGRGGITSIGGVNDYMPPKAITGSQKMNFRQDDLYPGYVVPPFKPDADVLAMAMDKTGARHLDHMLREGYPKRHKVAKCCRDILTPFAAKLAVHACGNYVLQRMLDYGAAHRGDAGNSECFFTAIVRSICRDNGLVSAARDVRGTFCVQKMLLLVHGTEELRLILKAVGGSVVSLSSHPYGGYVIQRLVETMITSLNPAGTKPRVHGTEAAKGLALLASEMTANNNDLLDIVIHPMNGLVLVECVRWSLPIPESLQAALKVVSSAKRLTGSKYGHRTLQGMLSLEVKQISEGLIGALEGELSALVMDSITSGWKLVKCCLACHCVDEGSRLLIVDELLGSLDDAHLGLGESQWGCDVLSFGLSLLTRRRLDDRLTRAQYRFPLLKFQRFRNGVEDMRKSLLGGLSFNSEQAKPTSAVSEVKSSTILDPWADDEPISVAKESTPALSEVSTSDLSADVGSDTWENLATSPNVIAENAESSTGPITNDTQFRSLLPESSNLLPNDNHAAISFPLLPLPPLPIVKPGTYIPHAHQALDFPTGSGHLSAEVGENTVRQQRKSGFTSQCQLSCVICASQPASTVLLDCSHMCCCSACAYLMKSCPACGNVIRQVVEVKPVAPSPVLSLSPPLPVAHSPPREVSSSGLITYPSARNLLPSDLFQSLSLNCECPRKPVNSSIACPYSQKASASSGLDSFATNLSQPSVNSIEGTYNLVQPVQRPPAVNTRIGPRRPYRPPDIFNPMPR